MASHPPKDLVRRFLNADLTAAREMIPHLVRCCRRCQAALQKVLTPLEKDHEAAIQRAERAVLRLWRPQEKRSKLLIQTVRLGVDPAIAERVEGLAGTRLLAALLEESHRLLAEDPLRAAQVACVAARASSTLEEALYGPALIHDWEARCCAEYGNALRAADQLAAAEVAFTEALLVLPQGTGDKALEARIYNLYASYYGTCRLFIQAEGASDHASALYLELGDRHNAGQVQLTKALYLQYSGRHEEALAASERGLGLIDHDRDPRLAGVGRFNALIDLVALGRYRAAEVALFQGRRVFLSLFGHVDRVKLRWLEARIDAGLKRFLRAEATLEEVRNEFTQLDMGFAAALATLDIALVCVDQEDWEKAEAEVQAAEAMFLALGIGRETLAAVAVFARCVERRGQEEPVLKTIIEDVFVKLIAKKTVAFVRRAEHDPEALFR